MRTVAEPNKNIIRLWGKQSVKTDEAYRLMKYVIRVEHAGKIALHNVVTGQLCILDSEEERILNELPASFTSNMTSLIESHFLVPEHYEENKQVKNLRTVLRRMRPRSTAITHYTILPTTACNARCYYCFEQGSKIVTMTEQTADDTVKFIAAHCGDDKRIAITWFGGEPTVAANRIDQICEGLQAEGIAYSSMIYTNGYLFDEEMARKARTLWHLNHVQMSVDGTEQIYNSVKAYVNAKENPYQRVMRNIGHMLDEKISVAVRMNVDYVNYQNFTDLVQEFAERYGGNSRLSVCAYSLIGEYADHDGNVNHADESWIAEKVEELNRYAKAKGFIRPSKELPQLRLNACMGDSSASITIGADGCLVKCAEQFREEDAVGTVIDGITNDGLIQEWQLINDSSVCNDCPFFPACIQLTKCSGAGHCYRQGKNQQCIWNIQHIMDCMDEGGAD